MRIYRIETRDCWSSDVQRLVGAKGQVIRRNGWLELRPCLLFADAVHLVDPAGAIADIHRIGAIECDSRGNAKVSCKRHRLSERRYAIHDAVHATANKHLSSAIKSDRRWIDYIAGKLRELAIDVDTEKRDRQMLAARA